MKKIVLSLVAFCSFVQAAEISRVAIMQWSNHSTENAIYQGITEELAAQGLHSEKLHLSYKNAQGNHATARRIADKFMGEAPQVIVAITTPAAEAVASVSDGKIPFVAISKWKKWGKHITGVSNKVPLTKQIKMIQRILPTIQRLGVVGNSKDVLEFVQYGKDHHLAVVPVPAVGSAEVLKAVKNLVGQQVDAIYLSVDNLSISVFEALAEVSQKENIPVFVSDETLVPHGAVAAVGFEAEEIGHLAGQQVIRLLEGENVADITVTSPSQTKFVVNLAAAKKVGISLPAEILQEAEKVFGLK